jgi:glycosyltransferase involved in cell wall biosynthesis
MQTPRDLVRSMVLFINRYFWPDHSATSQMLSDLAFGLAQRGIRVQVLTSRQRYDDPAARLQVREIVRGVEVRRVCTSRFGRTGLVGRAVDYATFYIVALAMLLRLAGRGDIVVAKTDPPLLSVVCALVARVRRAHAVNWLQDLFPEVAFELQVLPRSGAMARLLLWLRDRSLRMSTANVVIARRMQGLLIARGVPRRTIHRIPNWAHAPIEPIRTDGGRLRSRLNLANRFIVMYSGNLGRAHDRVALREAAAILLGESDIAFVLIGDGASMRELRKEALDRQLDNLQFEPYLPRPEVDDALRCADVHLVSLLPQLEGLILPSKLYGILAAGRPAVFIGHPRGEVARLLESSGAGAAVAAGDGVALADLLRRLRDDEELRRRQGLAARALFERSYTLAKSTDRWAALLARIAGSSL